MNPIYIYMMNIICVFYVLLIDCLGLKNIFKDIERIETNELKFISNFIKTCTIIILIKIIII